MQKIYNFATFIVSIIRFYKVQYSAAHSIHEGYRAIMFALFEKCIDQMNIHTKLYRNRRDYTLKALLRRV